MRLSSGEALLLQPAPVDAHFNIRCIEVSEICDQHDLDRLQKQLTDVLRGTRVPKADRVAVHDARMLVQEKLDQFHALFGEIARGVATGDGITGTPPLRYRLFTPELQWQPRGKCV